VVEILRLLGRLSEGETFGPVFIALEGEVILGALLKGNSEGSVKRLSAEVLVNLLYLHKKDSHVLGQNLPTPGLDPLSKPALVR
jgi:hypothetical protein